jgi:hypothetical protein
MRINENTLDLDTFVEYALGLGINMEIVELHKKVLLELCEEFRGFHLEGIGIKYVSIKKYLVPFFEVWHRNMPNVPKRMTSAFFNADFGFSYFFMDLFAHATVKNIIPQENQIFTDQFQIINQRQYLASVGYNINQYGSLFSFEPSVMYQHREATNENNIDINGKVYYELDNGMVWGGLSYRRSFDGAEFLGSNNEARSQKLQTLSPFVGINFGNFMFAYTYTNNAIQEITFSNSGFHQITLGFNFGEDRGRYKCNCPAVNW